MPKGVPKKAAQPHPAKPATQASITSESITPPEEPDLPPFDLSFIPDISRLTQSIRNLKAQ